MEAQTDSHPFRSTILAACRKDERYDRQTEDGRAPYLFDVLHATGEPDFYAAQLIEALRENAQDDARYQLIALATLMAKNGDAGARTALMDAFRWNIQRGDTTGADEIVALDGLEGYRLAAGQLATLPPDAADDWEHQSVVHALAEQFGEERIPALLSALAASNPFLRAYLNQRLDSWREMLKNWETRGKRSSLPADYETVRAAIYVPGKPLGGGVSRYARHADNDTTLRLAGDFLREENRLPLFRYLRFFGRRAFPLPPYRMIEFARSSDTLMAEYAIRALDEITHPAVRALAVEFAETPSRFVWAARLLPKNPGVGDRDVWRRFFAAPLDNLDEHDFHDIGFGLRDYFEERPIVSGDADVIIAAYEKTPCTSCRYAFVKMLVESENIPGWMRAECAYDAYGPTRELCAA